MFTVNDLWEQVGDIEGNVIVTSFDFDSNNQETFFEGDFGLDVPEKDDDDNFPVWWDSMEISCMYATNDGYLHIEVSKE